MTLPRIWTFARTVKAINGVVEEAPSERSFSSNGTIAAMEWHNPNETHQIDLFSGWASLTVNKEEDQAEILRLASGLQATDVSILAPAIGSDELGVLAKRSRISLLRLASDDIDPVAFDSLCRSTELPWIVFNCRPTAEHLRSLRAARGLQQVHLLERGGDDWENVVIQFPSEQSGELFLLPVKNMAVSFDDSKDLDLNQLDSLVSLTIVSSPIDDVVVSKTNALAGHLKRLYFRECSVTEQAIQALKKTNVGNIDFGPLTASEAKLVNKLKTEKPRTKIDHR